MWKKRAVVVSGDDDTAEEGRWKQLNPEILALFFVRIPADEMMRTVPFVCKSWREAVVGPYCWRDIDVEAWCRRRNETHAADVVVRKLVRRSKCTFQRLSAYRLGDSGFFFVANCGKCLKVLQIPMSDISDNMILKNIKFLSNLTKLDISNCSKITVKGLEAFGKQCKSLVYLKRNMPPWAESNRPQINDSEAEIIATTMSNLAHLELCFGRFGDNGLSQILSRCKSLTHLDIQGSWNVELKGHLEEICEGLSYFQSPWIDYSDGFFDINGSDGDEDEDGDSDMSESD